MAKRKNEILAAWRRGAKRLTMVVVLLVVMALGAGGFVLSSPASKYDLDAIAEYISFPRQAKIFEPFCLSISGLDDPRLPAEFLSSDIRTIEVHIDGMKVPSTSFVAFTDNTLPGAAHWCYPYGLDRGEHEISFRLQKISGEEIATYSWMLTVNQALWSDKTLQSRIVQLTTQEQYMPQNTANLHSITRETTAHAPICITAAIPEGVFDDSGFMINYIRWSEITINGVKVSSRKITIHTFPSSRSIEFCLNEGMNAGKYVANLAIKSDISDRVPDVSYNWVLTVQPGKHDEMREGCGRDDH